MKESGTLADLLSGSGWEKLWFAGTLQVAVPSALILALAASSRLSKWTDSQLLHSVPMKKTILGVPVGLESPTVVP